MSEYQKKDRAQLDAEWREAVRRDQQRAAWAWRGIREAEKRRAVSEDREEALRLYKEARLYDGLGNDQKAIGSYEAFLKMYRAEDELRAFARERVEALAGQGQREDSEQEQPPA